MNKKSNIRDRFPLLNVTVNSSPLIYFDNAATTQKPKEVIDEITKYYQEENSNIHRGVHHLSQISTSEMEHHSNIVPWQMCCQKTGANLKVVQIDDRGNLDMTHFKEILSNKTKIVAITHISNSLGTINPVKEIIQLSHDKNAKVLIDGAQAAAHLKVDVQDLDVDFYCFSAHKLFGPTGVGVLYGKEKILNSLSPYQGGGEMIEKVELYKSTYAPLPHKFEAGTPNIAGVIAFKKSINLIQEIGLQEISNYEDKLLQYATEKLLEIKGLDIIGTSEKKSAIISFNIKGIHHYDLGVLLDKMGVAIRTGHHCTQPVMVRFGVPGTARISFAYYNTFEEIDSCIIAINKAKNMLL